MPWQRVASEGQLCLSAVADAALAEAADETSVEVVLPMVMAAEHFLQGRKDGDLVWAQNPAGVVESQIEGHSPEASCLNLDR